MPRGVPSCAQAEGLTEPSILVDAFTSWCYEEEGYLQAGRGWFFRCGFGFCCVVVVVLVLCLVFVFRTQPHESHLIEGKVCTSLCVNVKCQFVW